LVISGVFSGDMNLSIGKAQRIKLNYGLLLEQEIVSWSKIRQHCFLL